MYQTITPDEGNKRIRESGDFPMSADSLAALLGTNHMAIRRAAKRLCVVGPAHSMTRYSQETALKLWRGMCEKIRKIVVL